MSSAVASRLWEIWSVCNSGRQTGEDKVEPRSRAGIGSWQAQGQVKVMQHVDENMGPCRPTHN